MRRPHDVPLSRQALDVLQRRLAAVRGRRAGVPLDDVAARSRYRRDAFNAALRRMGYSPDEMTPHGFRSTASTILNERGFNPDVIEAALGHQHAERNPPHVQSRRSTGQSASR